jgi:hypothetical protein
MRLGFDRLVTAAGVALLLSSCATGQTPSSASLSSPKIVIGQTIPSAITLEPSTSQAGKNLAQGNHEVHGSESASETLDSEAITEHKEFQEEIHRDSLTLDEEEEFDDTPDETIDAQTPSETTSSPQTTLAELPVATVIPSFSIGESNWRHVVDERQPGDDDTKPYIVRLERLQGSKWTPMVLSPEPLTGGMQTSLPVNVGRDLFVFVSIDDGTNAEIFLMKSSNKGAIWFRHGTVETAVPDKWPNAVNQYAIACNDWVINIDSEGSMVSSDGGRTWNSNGGYFQYRGTTPDEVVLVCGDPRATGATLPASPDQAKK